MSDESLTSQRAFVLGLDGVPWPLLQGWINDGKLPNLAQLVEEGAAGPLTSTTPATTPLAWPSIATGTRPDKHGIYGFRKLTSSYTPQMYTSNDLRQPTLWDILSPAQVGNVPMTYPAQPIDGTIFSGMMSSEINDEFAQPPEFRAELQERVPEYQIGLDWSEYMGREEELLSDLTDLVENRRKAMQLLMEADDWRLFFFVFTAPDRLQHLIWDEEVLLGHYRQLDTIVGEVLEYVQKRDGTLYVVSDHGFGPISKFVAVNRALENSGFLTRQSDSGTNHLFSKMGLSRDDIKRLLSKAGISGRSIVETVPEPLLRLVGRQLPGDDVLFDLEHSETRIFAHDHGCLYVNDTERFVDGCVAPDQRQSVKEEVATALADIEDPETGENVFVIYDGEELFPTDADSPDLVVRAAPGYEVSKSLSQETFYDTAEKAASHRSDGVFIAWGPNVQGGTQPTDASVYDVAPTLLHSIGEPIPESTDGRVLTEIFKPDSPAATQEPRSLAYQDRDGDMETEEDFEEVKDRLAGLGYLE